MNESVAYTRDGVRIAIAVVVVLIVLILFGAAVSSLYHLKEGETGILMAGGEIVGEPVSDPGWHFKRPGYTVRILSHDQLDLDGAKEGRRFWEGEPISTITSDRQRIEVEVSAFWSVSDPVRFRETLGDARTAEWRLDSIVDSAVRNQIAAFTVAEILAENEQVERLNRSLSRFFEDRDLEFGSDFGLVFLREQLVGIVDSRTDGNVRLAVAGVIVDGIQVDDWGDHSSGPMLLKVNEHIAGRIWDDAALVVERMDIGIEIDEVAVNVRVPRPVTALIED